MFFFLFQIQIVPDRHARIVMIHPVKIRRKQGILLRNKSKEMVIKKLIVGHTQPTTL